MVVMRFPYYGVIRGMVCYEYLPHMCFHYGFLHYIIRNCSFLNGKLMMAHKRSFRYESWLKAQGKKGEVV